MAKDNSVFDGVIKLLGETEHQLRPDEYSTVAALVAAIAYSDRAERNFFYAELMKIADVLGEKDRRRHKEVGNILRNYRNLWGDEELDEETCRLLDEEDAARKPKDIDEDDPKKKVVN